MKHFWIGFTILVVLLALSIGSLVFLDRTTERVASILDDAQDLEPAQALDKVQRAKDLWQRRYGLLAALTDHEDLEAICQGFVELETNPEDFETRCHALSDRIRCLAEAEMPHYYNFL